MKATSINKEALITILSIVIAILIAYIVAIAGNQGSIRILDFPMFGLCFIIIFAIQWVVFIPSYIFKTERFFDITGSLTYLSTVIIILAHTKTTELRSLLIAGCIAIWTIRLGIFLFSRINKAGSDGRFDNIKTNFLKLLQAWTLQGLWVAITIGAGLAALTSVQYKPYSVIDLTGLIIFLTGFSMEIISDQQKKDFNSKNNSSFITTGLWKYSRHPNYLGEIILWFGIAIMSATNMSGWQYITLISPIFVSLLLIKISGIPMVESRSDIKWGTVEEYKIYKKTTPVLIPNLFKLFKRN